MQYKFEIHKKETPYDGFFRMEVYHLSHSRFDGGLNQNLQREVFYRENAVAVLLHDPVNDNVIMIEQFRIGKIKEKNPWTIELVAGFQEAGESIEEVITREVMEESGLAVSSSETICEFFINPANTTDKIILTYAQVDSNNAGGLYGVDEEGEDIKVHVFTYQQIQNMLEEGEIDSAIPMIALQWLVLHHDRLVKD